MTFDEAADYMLKVFLDAWEPTGNLVAWSDPSNTIPDAESTWARPTIRHATGGQGSLSNDNGVRKWENAGTLFIQVFSPIGNAKSEIYNASQIIVNAFRSALGGDVWFRNARINEVPSKGAFCQINVLIDFQYDDVR